MKAYLGVSLLLVASLGSAACQSRATEELASGDDAITSNDGKALELRFDGEVIAANDTSAKSAILAQLEYAQGMFTTSVRGNAQFQHTKLTNIQEAAAADGVGEAGTKRITFTASLPVIWPTNTTVPAEYEVALPLDARSDKLSALNAKYDGKCGTNAYGRETFWHDWNPKATGCELGDDVHKSTATLRTHPLASDGKYLEYDRVWSDDRLDVVGVFGIITSFDDNDGGVKEFNAMLAEAERGLTNKTKVDVTPGATVLKATKLSGKKTIDGRERTISVTAILVHSVASAGRDFDDLYKPATEVADYIYYGGHSGLGTNIQSLASRARVTSGKYQVVYLNGCQTFGYLGTAWNDKKRDANGAAADPEGTKDLDVFVTGLPAYDDGARSMLSIYQALEGVSAPKTVNTILESFSSYHLNVAFGEDDNQFRP